MKGIKRKKLSEYQKQDSLKQEFLGRKRQADHIWNNVLIRLEFGEKISKEEIVIAMDACIQADKTCLKYGYLNDSSSSV